MRVESAHRNRAEGSGGSDRIESDCLCGEFPVVLRLEHVKMRVTNVNVNKR